MKKLNLIRVLFLSCVLFSCEPKAEKKQPIIYNNNQNYKFDDDEIIKRNTEKTKIKNTVSQSQKNKASTNK